MLMRLLIERLSEGQARIGSPPLVGSVFNAMNQADPRDTMTRRFDRSVPHQSSIVFWALTITIFSSLVFRTVAADRTVDPTFLRRSLSKTATQPSDVSTATCRFKPIFGSGTPDAQIVKGIARFGEMTVDAGGASKPVQYAGEEEIYLVLEGRGLLNCENQKAPLRAGDFMYIPPSVKHGILASSSENCRVLLAGFKIPEGTKVSLPPKLLLANIDEVPKQTVSGHPPSVLYQLLIGDLRSTRDKIAAGHVLSSLYIMEFATGGTNFPHHHETEEEIYLLLDGYGEMVAGSGLNGVEGRYPAQVGDAYFFRLNCTAGFYNNQNSNSKTHVLGVRSLFPFPMPSK